MRLDVVGFAGLTDRQLLDRFAAGGDFAEGAFAALVARHGPMVLCACRAVLRDPHAAEDAFQATFLVLVRRCGALWVRESLGPWLHRVASRVAIRARASAVERRRHEWRAASARAEARAEADPDDLAPLLHAEIDRLPACYRNPVVLCDLEGLTHEAAAGQLGCPVGTVKSRLSRARERLKARLTRRGVFPAAGGAGALFAGHAAAVSPSLPWTTARAASLFATGGTPADGTSPAAVILAEGVLTAMTRHTMTARLAAVLAAALAATGALVLVASAGPSPAPEPAAKASLRAPVPRPPANPVPKELQPFQGEWVVGNVMTDAWPKPLGKGDERKWIVKGNEIAWTGLDGKEVKASFAVDPSKVPGRIDLTFLSGPHKGETCPGVYKWLGADGKELWLCLADPGSKAERPKDISFASNGGRSWIAINRAAPPADRK